MSEKIVVPEGMLKAGHKATTALGGLLDLPDVEAILEAALRWLSENPRPMDISFARELDERYHPTFNRQVVIAHSAVEWQRRMFKGEDEDEIVYGQAVMDSTKED